MKFDLLRSRGNEDREKCPVPPIPGSWPSALILTAATSGAQEWLIMRSRVEKNAFPAQIVAFLRIFVNFSAKKIG